MEHIVILAQLVIIQKLELKVLMDVLLVLQEVWLDLQDHLLVVFVLLESLQLMESIVMIARLALIQKKELMVRILVYLVLKEVQLDIRAHQAAQLARMGMYLSMDIIVLKISRIPNFHMRKKFVD